MSRTLHPNLFPPPFPADVPFRLRVNFLSAPFRVLSGGNDVERRSFTHRRCSGKIRRDQRGRQTCPPLTILPIDTDGYAPSQSGDPLIVTSRYRRRSPAITGLMVATKQGWIMPGNDSEAVAEFIRTKGITRCPTACVLPTQGLVAAADRVALEEHAIARDRLRRAQACGGRGV